MARVGVPRGTLYHLPGFDPAVRTGGRMALTVDDGTDAAVVGAYAQLCRDTGLRVTFFVNGVNRSWTEHAPALRALHDAGQIFLANHTWSHPDLTKLSPAAVTDQVRRNEQFLSSTFGTLGRPFLRPPFGARNAAVIAQLADLGYPAVTMWEGSIGDATAEKIPKLLGLAAEWFRPGRIVIGHANHPGVTTVYDQLIELIHSRGIQPVHLGDVFRT
jgi:peptidoglycan-N-acetylglucosamine deacetylase